jgi:hypothetical protein
VLSWNGKICCCFRETCFPGSVFQINFLRMPQNSEEKFSSTEFPVCSVSIFLKSHENGTVAEAMVKKYFALWEIQ